MKYALPETTIGVKWQCVWNGIRKIILQTDKLCKNDIKTYIKQEYMPKTTKKSFGILFVQ